LQCVIRVNLHQTPCFTVKQIHYDSDSLKSQKYYKKAPISELFLG